MQGDFSRFSFDPHKHYSGVRMQQGRVQIDADWNEQMDILRYELETHLKDLIGPAGGPAEDMGFEIIFDQPAEQPAKGESRLDRQKGENEAGRFPDFKIGAGHYYVNGVLCQNEEPVSYTRQPDFPGARLPVEASKVDHYLVYLDVWQRHMTYIQDPDIREVALGEADTATRTHTIWQIKLMEAESGDNEKEGAEGHQTDLPEEWQDFLELNSARGRLRARHTSNPASVENQLYRVEIQKADLEGTTFKWSRENGSVAFPVNRIQEGADAEHWFVSVTGLERDPLTVKPGDWVELANDETSLNNLAGPLAHIETVDAAQGKVLVQIMSGMGKKTFSDSTRHPLLRRWDQNEAKNGSLVDGALTLEEDRWIGLENGIEVFFTSGGQYQPGDYWVIPARTQTGGIDWPQGKNGPLARPPHGVRHDYCLLAQLAFSKERWKVQKDFRRPFLPARVVASEDFTALRELQSDRTALHKIEIALAEMVEVVETLKRDQGQEREHLYLIVRSSELLEAGDVVSLESGRDHHVVRTNRDNETLVLGVVSEVFDEMEEGETRVRVMTYGRGRAKVLGPVRAGDRLVPSKTEGCAHKAGLNIRPGALIGKALETYEPADRDEIGLIDLLVLLG